MFCQRKYIKDEKSGGSRGNIRFDENAFMLVMDVSSPRVVFSLPSLMFGEILGGLLESPEAPLAANHIPGETEDENAFILQKTVSPRMKFITTPLHCIGYTEGFFN